MKRITGCVLMVALLALPAHAVGPFAFLAKDLVKGIVRSFVEGQLNQMLATAGPCGLPIAGSGALTGLAGMAGGRGAMPGLPSIPGAGGMPSVTGVAGAAKGVPGTATAGQLGGLAAGGMPMMSGTTLPPGMADLMKKQMAPEQAMATEQAVPDMATALQALQDRTPMSAAEVDELGTLLERMTTAMPSAVSKCKPGEMKAVVQMAADSPMGGGMMRMMLGSMRDMQLKLDEARDTFARMPEPERGEYVETMAAEYRGWDKENKQALLGMMETNFLGMPDDMKTQLLARLKQEK